VHAVEDGLERRVGDALPEDVEGLDEWHPGLEQGGQLLVKDQKLLCPNSAHPFRDERQAGQTAPAVQRKDEEPLFFEIATQTGFIVGDVDALNHLAAWRSEPAPEFHDEQFCTKTGHYAL
jgi:hypothetical protein